MAFFKDKKNSLFLLRFETFCFKANIMLTLLYFFTNKLSLNFDIYLF